MNRWLCDLEFENEDPYQLVRELETFSRFCSNNTKYLIEYELKISNPSTLNIKIYKNDRSNNNS